MGVAWQMAHVPDSDADIDWFLHGDPPAPTDAVPVPAPSAPAA